MGIRVDGRIVIVKARRGPDGVQEFERKVRDLLGYPDDVELDFTFSCSAPDSNEGGSASLWYDLCMMACPAGLSMLPCAPQSAGGSCCDSPLQRAMHMQAAHEMVGEGHLSLMCVHATLWRV
jgi:hypothetical protein